MVNLWVVAGAGFLASFVDGALGMGFGPTSSTILLASGVPPKASSATINLVKVVVGIVAGASHWKMGNIDRKLVVRLAIPGMIGGFIGANILSNVDGKALRPWLAVILLIVGIRILQRFRRSPTTQPAHNEPATDARSQRGVSVAGLLGGTTNGLIGAWGPVVTPYLLHRNVAPRTAIGSVNTAEIPVAAAAAGSLITLLAKGTLDLGIVLAMLSGGIVAAPVAAWSVRFLAPRVMGLCVAGLLLITNIGPAGSLVGINRFGIVPELGVTLIVLAVMMQSGAFQRSSRRTPQVNNSFSLSDLTDLADIAA
jgi:uncharacterized protein